MVLEDGRGKRDVVVLLHPAGAVRIASARVECAVARVSGVCALDEDAGDKMRCIEFPRIKGGKPFPYEERQWFTDMLAEIGQVPKSDAYPVDAA